MKFNIFKKTVKIVNTNDSIASLGEEAKTETNRLLECLADYQAGKLRGTKTLIKNAKALHRDNKANCAANYKAAKRCAKELITQARLAEARLYNLALDRTVTPELFESHIGSERARLRQGFVEMNIRYMPLAALDLAVRIREGMESGMTTSQLSDLIDSLFGRVTSAEFQNLLLAGASSSDLRTIAEEAEAAEPGSPVESKVFNYFNKIKTEVQSKAAQANHLRKEVNAATAKREAAVAAAAPAKP